MTSPPPPVDGAKLLERFRQYLRERGLPVTHQREAVAAALLLSRAHQSVGDIAAAVADRGERVGKATVYRTVELLTAAGLIEAQDFGEGFKRYEPVAALGHHEHLICTDCGRVVEFSSDRLERMNQLIAEEHGYRHHRHRLEIFGVCEACQRRDTDRLGALHPQRKEPPR